MDDVFYPVGFDPVKKIFIGCYSFADWLNAMDSSPLNQLEWELCEGRSHSGPGLATVINLDLSDPNDDEAYLGELSFWTERGMPWVAHHSYGYYQPEQWNEENDSLVRDLRARQRRPESYDQLLLDISLV